MNGVEQIAEADLLAVMLFADVWFVVEQKGMPAGAGSLAPPLYEWYKSKSYPVILKDNLLISHEAHIIILFMHFCSSDWLR